MCLLDPKNDYVVKRLFAVAPHLLTALINAIRSEDEALEVMEVLNPRIDPEDLAGKFIVPAARVMSSSSPSSVSTCWNLTCSPSRRMLPRTL